MNEIKVTKDTVHGCFWITGICLVACFLSFGLGYLIAWLVHT